MSEKDTGKDPYLTAKEMAEIWRPLSREEASRFNVIMPNLEDTLRQEAMNHGWDLDKRIEEGTTTRGALRLVCVDVMARYLTQPTESPTATQIEGLLGEGSFSMSASTGLFIKRDELARLGLKQQTIFSI